MHWITALVAFATTMLIFAIIVSTFVELIHRAFKLRGQGMQLMLENLYTRAIELHLTTEQKEKMSAIQFATIIMENRAIEQSKEPRGRIATFFHWLVDSSSITDIPVEVFTQKLADSRIVGSAENFTDEVLQDIAQKYEAFGHEVGNYFGRRARVFSVGVAFVVVWLFYVHPYNLAVTYFKNPTIAQSVADKVAETRSDYRVLIDRLQSVSREGEVDGGDATELSSAIEELRQAVAAAHITNKELANLGVPIGWPGPDVLIANCFHKRDTKPVDSAASEDALLTGFCRIQLPFDRFITLPSIPNAFWLIIGGLLVGLGAPFWAQAVSSLTATRDLTRRITKTVSSAGEDSGGRSRARGVAQTMNDTPTHVKTFNVALSGMKSSVVDEGLADSRP